MSLFSKLGSLFKRSSPEPTAEELMRLEQLRAQVRERCTHFRSLLSANKRALETMSEMEERLVRTTHPFGLGYVSELGTRTATAVFQMIRELNALTSDAYPGLVPAFTAISQRMEAVLAPKQEAELGALILPLSQITLACRSEVGGKMANLGEVASGAGLRVPDGFAITVSAYRLFLRENGLESMIEQRIRATDMENMDQLFTLSASLRQEIQAAKIPARLEQAINEAVAQLSVQYPSLRLAMRSSAVGEDAMGASFAGQYASELNVLPEEACDVWKEIIASKYTVAALSYRYQRGIPDSAAPMSVGVLRMVQAEAGGVAYSVAPVSSGHDTGNIVLNSVFGLPAAVVDGRVTPDTFVFSHTRPLALLDKRIENKAGRLDSDPTSATGMCYTPFEADAGAKASISEEEALLVARLALALEEYYNTPQDVEWALERVDGQAKIIILQSRPLQVEEASVQTQVHDHDQELETLLEGREIIAQGGVGVSDGIAIGPVFIARRDADILSFPVGGILVVEHAYPRWAPLLPRAAGMLSESGGMAGHLASVAREYGVPALFSIENVTSILHNGQEVTLDADTCRVFSGAVPELAKFRKEKPNFMAGSPVMTVLKDLAECVVPLHLLDPQAATFTPEHCTSLHDITRFCHEKAADYIFAGDTDFSKNLGKQLKAGVKLQYWIIDMEDAFKRDILGPVVDISEINSAPMLELWAGLTAIPWAGPPLSSASGFMSVVLESTMNPELEVTACNTMAERNYFILSKEYMLLQARYGYHFCTVEAMACDEEQENFVSFQFKGGAADAQRRHRRAAMIAELLDNHGFRADVRGDSMFAVAEGYAKPETLRRVRQVGYLLLHTRQCDMIMGDDAQALAFKEKLAHDLESFCKH